MRSRTFRFAFAAVAAIALAAPAAAEERLRVGVGVGLTTFDFNVSTLANGFPAAVPDSIYVPINLTSTVRIEPQLGIATLSQNTGNNPSIETSVVSLGLGIFWRVPVAPEAELLVGGRVVRTTYTLKQKFDPPRGTETQEGADLRLIPAVGGEYALHPRFSLGVEAELQIITFGDRTISTGGSIPGGTGVQTAALLFARVYLF